MKINNQVKESKKRRPRFYSENVENKKIEIINFERPLIEDNYISNKLTSDKNLDSIKLAINEEPIKIENQRKFSTPIYYSDYYTVYNNQ